MIIVNHAITGALIAVAVKTPELAIPLAFVSHFLLDALPHFGLQIVGDDVKTRNDKVAFKVVTRLDTFANLLAFIFIPIALRHVISPVVVLLAMSAAVSPDLVWVYRYFKESKTGKLAPRSWFSKFHKRIQWGERSWGIVFDLSWLGAAIYLVTRWAQ